MLELPTIAHVTMTGSDLDRSVRWYERFFEVKLTFDESPGPFRRAVWLVGGQTLVGLHQLALTPTEKLGTPTCNLRVAKNLRIA